MFDDLTCTLCENVSIVLSLGNNKRVCFDCMGELRKFVSYAPMPNQEQPDNYFPKIKHKVYQGAVSPR
jgi:hypothetical protein